MYHDILPTRALLNKIGVNCNRLCCFCSSNLETTVHIFFDYPNAKLFRYNLTTQSITVYQKHHPIFTSHSWSNTWTNLKKKPFNNNLSLKAIFTLYFCHIWLTMNHNLFKRKRDHIFDPNVIAKATEYHTITIGDTM